MKQDSFLKNRQLQYMLELLKNKNLSLISKEDTYGLARGNIKVKCNICGEVFDIKGARFSKSNNPEKNIKCKKCEFNSKLEQCFIVAKQYNRRSIFAEQSPYEYGFLMRNQKLNEACSHMEIVGNKEHRLIYVYLFQINELKYAYVGLTYDLEKRHQVHCRRGTVYKFSIEHNVNIPLPIKLTDYMDKNISSLKEGEFVELYKKKGYIILNKKETGGLGGNMRHKEYTLSDLKNIASKYKNRTEWKREDYPSYYYASSRHIIDEVFTTTTHTGPKRYYTYDKVKEIISELPSEWSIKEFSIYNCSLYTIICRNKWYDLLEHFKRNWRKTNLTIEDIKTTLNKCQSITEFSTKFPHMRNWCGHNKIKLSDLTTDRQRLYKKETISQKLSKPILCFDENGNFVKRYKNAREAVVDGFSYKKISLCCNGKSNTHKNHIFKFDK